MRPPLDGMVALVTGSTSGIGLATARELVGQGASVMLTGRDAARGEAALAEMKQLATRDDTALRERGQPERTAAERVTFAAADIRRDSDVQWLIEQTESLFGRLDILVNNAGGLFRYAPFTELSPSDWEAVLEMYFRSRLRVTQAVLPIMRRQAEGAIVNLVTDAGRLGAPLESVFAGAMGGLIAWSKSLARELAPERIRVNCIAITAVQGTRLYQAGKDDTSGAARLMRAIEERTPLGTTRPEDVATAMAFLASPAANHITGQVLSINGGLSFPG